MNTKIVCINPKCKAQLKRPQTPFIKCPSCNTDFFVFCHEFPFKLFEHIQCKKCPNELYYFFCFKCTGLMNFVKYRMGSISSCKCGFNACYVVCDKCKKPECFPPDKRYEGTTWKCNFCKNPFNFMTCDNCFHQVYDTDFTAGQNLTCENKACKAKLTVKNCEGCKFIFIDSRGRNRCEPCYEEQQKNRAQNPPTLEQAPRRVPPAAGEPKKPTPIKSVTTTSGTSVTSNKSIPEQLLCKICLDKEAEFIHTKCFHMSVCETCVTSMKNMCPICRAVGQFRKVFK